MTLNVLADAPAKPRWGSPCNGCGACCAAEVCRVGLAVYGDVPAPCPGMTFRAGRFWCEPVELADRLDWGWFLRLTIGIGVGCDMDDAAEVRQ